MLSDAARSWYSCERAVQRIRRSCKSGKYSSSSRYRVAVDEHALFPDHAACDGNVPAACASWLWTAERGICEYYLQRGPLPWHQCDWC